VEDVKSKGEKDAGWGGKVVGRGKRPRRLAKHKGETFNLVGEGPRCCRPRLKQKTAKGECEKIKLEKNRGIVFGVDPH